MITPGCEGGGLVVAYTRLKERVTLFLFSTVALNCLRASSTSPMVKEPETVVPSTCTFLVCANCKKNQTDAVFGKDKIMGFMPKYS